MADVNQPCPHARVEWEFKDGRGGWWCVRCGYPFRAGLPKDEREVIASEITMREYVEVIAQSVRSKLMRYLELEVFATQKDDHTKSLSERVTHLENELGELREAWRQHRSYIEWERGLTTWQLIKRRIHGRRT